MKLFYEDELVTLWQGDCREFVAPSEAVVIADPPYQQTSLAWDRWPAGWLERLTASSMWCFGSLRMFMGRAIEFSEWKLSQDIVWEKQNGSSSAADRFRRVHEQAAHFYRGSWGSIYKFTVTTPDAVKRQVRRKHRPPHWGAIGSHAYESHDGGPRQIRSVVYVANCHGYAEHPTQKPIVLLQPLIEYAVPAGGLVYVPFAGVGSELETARFLGRRAIGVEIQESLCDLAARRLSAGLPLQFEPAAPSPGQEK